MNTEELDQLCRICLKTVLRLKSECFTVEDIAENVYQSGKQWSYQELFQHCTGYSILENEPQIICRYCADDLLKTYEFKSRCENTQNVLDSFVPKLEVIDVKIELGDDLDNHTIISRTIENLVEGPKPWRYDKDSNDDNEDDRRSNYFEYESIDGESCEPIYDEDEIKRLAVIKLKKKSHVKQRYNCEYCTISYKHRSNLMQHYKSQHLDKKVHECPYCKESFYTIDFLESHKKDCGRRPRTEVDKKRHLCPVCGKPSSNNHILYHTQKQARHDSSSGGMPKETFVCDICGVSVTSRYSMINHMKVQHFNQRTKCKYCEATFRSPSYLSTHVRKIHLQETPIYKCGKCEFVATSDTYLKRHRMTHSGKKPLKCSLCDYECFTKYSYDCHMASHSDARPHTCEVCGSAFKTTKALRSHKKTHAEYDYECPVCQKGFFSNHLMRAHVKKLHSDYTLPPPGTIFSKSALKRMAEKELQEMAMRNGIGKDETELTV